MASLATRTQPGHAPGPRGHWLWGNYRESVREPLEFARAMQREYGDIVRLRSFGPFYWHQVTHPDGVEHVLKSSQQLYHKGFLNDRFKILLGEGLLTSEGSFWLRQRRLAQPAFHRQRLQGLAGLMTGRTELMLERWQGLAAEQTTFDVANEMMHLTFEIVGQALFSTDVSGVIGPVEQALDQLRDFVMGYLLSPLPLPINIPLPAHRRFLTARAELDRIVYGIISEHRRSTERSGDLLAMLLEAQDADTGEAMSDQQLRDEVMTLLLAGHETTAVTLSWLWYLLAQHPQVEAKLVDELRHVLAGRSPTIADLAQLPYTRMVVDEALRLYPPAQGMVRETLQDDVIQGYHIPAKSLISLSQYTTHRHPAFWDAPDVFDPERWTPERSASRPAFAYFPFGGGPRQCIGNQFALMEAQLLLATIAQQYRLVLDPAHVVEPQVSITLRPRTGVRVHLEPR